MVSVYQRPRRTKEQTQMNNTLEGINSRRTEAEERVNELEDRTMEITATEQNIEQRTHYRKLNSLKKQKAISLMKGQDKTLGNQLNEV